MHTNSCTGPRLQVIFENFSTSGQVAGESPIWQNFQTSQELLIPNNCTSINIRTINCLLLTCQYYTPQPKTFEELYPALVEGNSRCQHHMLPLKQNLVFIYMFIFF